MEIETPEIDPDLERRSRRNKIGVTIGFIVLIITTLFMARLLVSIVKPVQTDPPPAAEVPAPDAP
mgnify:CR=1 FL=1